ncbi:MAG: autotransporter outer membrane beta-barrel domain-containing protein, partial [Planctomycetota bacterium]
MKSTKMLTILVLVLGLVVCTTEVSEAAPMGTAFTYQGRLMDANSAADELYDFQFKLYDEPGGGSQLGSDVNNPDVDVIDGYFTVELDFGSGVFDGNAVWLEIGVRPGDQNDPNAYTTLIPRQEVTPVPYALQTRGIFVDSAGKVGIGTTSPDQTLHLNGSLRVQNYSFFHGGIYAEPWFLVDEISLGYGGSNSRITSYDTDENITIDPAGAGDIVLQGNVGIGTTGPGDKLDVNGNININSVYKIGGETVLANPGEENLFVGVGAGASNTEGKGNTFLGYRAGYSNIGDPSNVVWGSFNTFLGYRAGRDNITGFANTFVGHWAGANNETGHGNTSLGTEAGRENTEGYGNTFVGYSAGVLNSTGHENTFLGDSAGTYNLTGSRNVFIGHEAGLYETGSNKLYIANSRTTTPLIYGDFSTGYVGIGTTEPLADLHIAKSDGASIFTIEGSGTNIILDHSDTDGSWILGGGTDFFIDEKDAFGTLINRFLIGPGGDTSLVPVGGNVGIGTTNPSEKLEVAGTVKAVSSSGNGVYAENSGSGNKGILGGSWYGVYADSNSGHAVHGKTISGYAGYFEGNVHVAGLINKSACSFKIDHPRDP